MAVSQNGWPVITSSSDSRLVNFPSITGKVRAGDVAVVLTWYQKQYSNRVEAIRRDWSWGWANRNIRGGSSPSNHGSATALDNNAPRHPLGTSPNKTMTAKQRREIRAIVKESGGVLRWGGDYYGRKDSMHIEINASAAAVRNFANKIRGGGSVKPTSPSKPKPIGGGEFPAVALVVDGVWKSRTTRAYELMLRDAAGTYKRAIDDNFGYHAIVAEQTWLKNIGWYKGEIDGKRGSMTIAALRGFLKSKKLYKATDKAPTNRALQRYLNTQRKYIRR